jgi:hypothetical protein
VIKLLLKALAHQAADVGEQKARVGVVIHVKYCI